MHSTGESHWASHPIQRVLLDPDTFLGSGLAILMGSPNASHTLRLHLTKFTFFWGFKFTASDRSPRFAAGFSECLNKQFKERLKGLMGEVTVTPVWSTELRSAAWDPVPAPMRALLTVPDAWRGRLQSQPSFHVTDTSGSAGATVSAFHSLPRRPEDSTSGRSCNTVLFSFFLIYIIKKNLCHDVQYVRS